MTGLESVAADQRPPVNVVRAAFQTMVGIGSLLALLGVVYLAVWVRRRRLPESAWFYRALVAAGPLAIVALIAGWVVTEVGRQPWVVYRVMPTAAAVTGAHGIPVGYWRPVRQLPARRVRSPLGAAPPGALAAEPSDRAAVRAATGGLADGAESATARVRARGTGALHRAADFGAGFWQLFAGRGERAERVREHAHRAMGPVWEANHVWLIFMLVILWTAYPRAFGSIASTLGAALFVAAIGIIFRGAAYAFRAGAVSARESAAIDTVFSLSSILTPFARGAAIGAIATDRVPVGNAAGHLFSSWLNPMRLLGVGDRPMRLLRKVRGIDLVELQRWDECCGFGGTFSVKNPDVSAAMLADKMEAVIASGAEVLCAGDRSCLMHIGGGLERIRAGVRTMHLAEILDGTEPDHQAARSAAIPQEKVS